MQTSALRACKILPNGVFVTHRHAGSLKTPSSTCQSRATRRRTFTVLALESSADDTCAAVVTSGKRILSNVVMKQHQQHNSYGGIHPYVAIQTHQRNMPLAVHRALDEANMRVVDVDGIAFTRGPGMPGCLGVCSNAAKTLAAALNKPLVGVNHMQAHALTPFLTTPESELPHYPFLTLLVSGGHTLLLLATSSTSFRLLASTVDASIGRAIDKVALRLGMKFAPIGLGPALEAFCADGPENAPLPQDALHLNMPPAMRGTLTFSYGGLQSAFERWIEKRGGENNIESDEKRAVARALQASVFRQLEEKVVLGLQWCTKQNLVIRHVVVSGGVASNLYLRKSLRAALDIASPDTRVNLLFPPPALCTDNAAMIAWASMERFLNGQHDDYSVEIIKDWSIEDLKA